MIEYRTESRFYSSDHSRRTYTYCRTACHRAFRCRRCCRRCISRRSCRAYRTDRSLRDPGRCIRHPQRHLRAACGKGRFQSHTGCCVWCDRTCTCRDLTDHGFQCTEPARMRDPGALLRICTECQKRRKLRHTTHKTANRSLIDGLRFFLSYFCLFFYRFIHFHHSFPVYRVPHIRRDL